MNRTPTVTLVKPDAFDEYRWWEPQRLHRDPRWFYGVRGDNGRAAKHPTPNTVDAPLRDLVSACVRAGVTTLPSCAGHFPSEQGLRRVYAGLRRDAEWVRSYGLTLRCSESGSLQVYRNPAWTLPDYETWAAPIRQDAGNGRIGLVFDLGSAAPERIQASLVGLIEVCTHIQQTGSGERIVEITVKSRNRKERDYLWYEVTRRLTGVGKSGRV